MIRLGTMGAFGDYLLSDSSFSVSEKGIIISISWILKKQRNNNNKKTRLRKVQWFV